MTTFTSLPFSVSTRPVAQIQQVAAGLAPWSLSPELDLPWLNSRTYRIDPEYPIDTPDRSRGSVLWFWGSRMCWDPVKRRIMGALGSHRPGDVVAQHPEYFCLNIIDVDTDCVIAYENALGGRLGSHLFDTTCFDPDLRWLLKWTKPHTVAGSYTQPQLCVIHVDSVTLDKVSADNGAALLPEIPRMEGGGMEETIAGALDYMPLMGAQGSYVYFHRDRFWRYDKATATWSGPTLAPNVQLSIWHNVGHYHPIVGKMICGGGSGQPGSSQQFWIIDNAGNITETDSCPAVLSVNNSNSDHKAVFAPAPSSRKSVALHTNGNAYVYDWDAPAGTRWSTLVGAISGVEPGWVCSIPDFNTLVIGDFRYSGNVSLSRCYAYRCD